MLAATPDKKAARDSVRAFMVPGMGHCGGGEGTSTFDMVAAVDQWVESGVAPRTDPGVPNRSTGRRADAAAVRVSENRGVQRNRQHRRRGEFRVQVTGPHYSGESSCLIASPSPRLPLRALSPWRSRARSSPASITVTGPVALTSAAHDASHGYPFNASTLDLAKQGFVEEEFFIQGTARSYEIPRDQQSNGTPAAATHPYKTRIVVRRPAAAGKFNGTAIVEWTNVSEGFDNEVDWFHSADHFVNAGYAWIGVSAQNVGVSALKQWSPGRYAFARCDRRRHGQGDALSYDIFAAAGQAVRGRAGSSVMGTLRVERVIATGHSQSAGRLATYFNSVHPLTPVYDAVVLHGGGGKMRADLNVKIWKLLLETDVLGQVADAPGRQRQVPHVGGRRYVAPRYQARRRSSSSSGSAARTRCCRILRRRLRAEPRGGGAAVPRLAARPDPTTGATVRRAAPPRPRAPAEDSAAWFPGCGGRA